MPTERPQSRGRAPFGLSTGRVEAFSDGVFAIAATLLILNVHLPTSLSGGLARALLALWPEVAVYAASFLTIGIMWLNHHALFSRLAHVDRPLILLNLLLLMVISFIPFPTQVLGSHLGSGSDAHVAALFYLLNAILIGTGFSGVYVYAVYREGLLSPRFSRDAAKAALPWYALTLAAYAVCVPLAFISPVVVVLVIALVSVYYAFDRMPGPTATPSPAFPTGGREI